jgi:hypothetical protein
MLILLAFTAGIEAMIGCGFNGLHFRYYMNILVAGSHDSGKLGAIVPAIQSHFVLA